MVVVGGDVRMKCEGGLRRRAMCFMAGRSPLLHFFVLEAARPVCWHPPALPASAVRHEVGRSVPAWQSRIL